MKLTQLSIITMSVPHFRAFGTISTVILTPNHTTDTTSPSLNTSNTTAMIPPYTEILKQSGDLYIAKTHNTEAQDKEDISELVKFCKNIPFLPTDSHKIRYKNDNIWDIRFKMNYDVSQKTFTTDGKNTHLEPVSRNQWLQRTLGQVLHKLRPDDPHIRFILTGIFRDSVGVKPHKDIGYDTAIIAMGAFRKDNDQPLEDPYMDLMVDSYDQKDAIPQNPAGGHWAIFNGHRFTHFTMDHPESQSRYEFLKKEIPPYYRLQITAHVAQADSGD